MQLIIPFTFNGKVYDSCGIDKPKASVIADTKKNIDETGDAFSAMRILLNGCISAFNSTDGNVVSDKIAIKSLVPKLPLKTAEHLTMSMVVKHYADDDGIEGVYPCPRCGVQNIAEIVETDGMTIDTRDHISALGVTYCDFPDLEITQEFTTPVLIENAATKDVLYDIQSIVLKIPTLENAISAYAKIGSRDMVRLQFAMYVEALYKVNGESVDSKFKNSFGMALFNNVEDPRKDLGELADQINKYGVDKRVDKTCKKCGKVWRAAVNTSNFFVSGVL